MEVFGLAEFLELVVDGLCFFQVGLYGEVLLIFLSYEVFEFLLHF
jgi:hypothetical protein